MQHQLRILHVSDLHERVALKWMDESRQRIVQGQAASRYRVLGPTFFEVLIEIREQQRIDIVCFTGDIADWGLKEEYEQATARVDAIISGAGVTRDRLFLVPGNHDVYRKEAQDTWEKMRPFAVKHQLDLSKWMAGEKDYPDGGQSIWREDILRRTTAFWQWVTEGLGRGEIHPKCSRHPCLGYCVPVKGLPLPFPVHIIGLDSAWLAGDNNDPKKLLLTERQVDLLTTDTGGRPLSGLRLALVHHPLPDIADGETCRNLLANTVDLLMHGHQHEEITIELSDSSKPCILGAGSLYEGEEEDKWVNSFHVLDIQLNEEGKPLRYDVEFWGWSQKALYWYRTGEFCKEAKEGRATWLTELGKKMKAEAPPVKPDQKLLIAGTRPKSDDIFFDKEFKDRNAQCKDACRLLGDKTKRLICIFGHYGMGKTSLVTKVLRDIERKRWPQTDLELPVDGIVYLGAAEGVTFENLFENCVKVLNSKSRQQDLDAVWRSNQSIDKKIKKLLEALNEGQFVILMDGVEGLLDDQGKFKKEHGDLSLFFEMALQNSTGSKILLTSTKPLKIDEVSLRQRAEQKELREGLPLEDAIARLRELDPEGDLGLKDASDDQLTNIVKVTYGIPRALEQIVRILSEAKNRKLTLDDIVNRFYKFDEVVNELVAETYKGLDTGARRIAEALAVFDRPVPEEAIYFVLQTAPNNKEVYDIITRLAETHLINWDRKAKVFSLHPIDQSYTYSRIPEEDGGHNRKELHRRAAGYYATQRTPKERWNGKEDIDPQLFEFEQRLKAEDYDGGAQLMDEIDYSWSNHHKYLAYLMAWGYGSDSIKRREKLLGKLSPNREVYNRTSLGWVCRRMGRKKEAGEHLRLAVERAQAGGDAAARFYALSELGYFLTDNADEHDKAETYLKDALQIASTIGDRYSQAHALLGLAFADFQRQRNSSSMENASRALTLFQQVPTQLARYREVDCWVRLGMIHRKEGNYLAAIQTTEEGLKVANTHGLVDWKAELYSGLGFHHRAQGRYEAAVKDHEDALTLFKDQRGMKREEAVQYSYLGNLYTDMGDFDDALDAYGEAQHIAQSVGLRRELSWIVANKGVLYCRIGDYKKAYNLQQLGLQIVQENNHLDSQVVRFTDLAATLLAMGQHKEAEEALLNALQSAAKDEKIDFPASLPAAYLEAPYLEDKLPHEMQSPADHQRRGALLSRILLQTGRLEIALQVIEVARRSQIENPHQQYLAALHGLAFMRLKRFREAEPLFRQAIKYAENLLGRTPNFYGAQYILGLSYSALALLSTGQLCEENLQQSIEAYRKALQMCGAAGVVKDARSLFIEIAKLDEEGTLSMVEMTLSGGRN